jgi:RND superfamily putative drug exporter
MLRHARDWSRQRCCRSTIRARSPENGLDFGPAINGARRKSLLIVAVWLVLALVATPFATRIHDVLDPAVRLRGSESERVDNALRERFKSPFTQIALLHVENGVDARTADGQAVLKRVTEAVRTASGVQGVMSYLDNADSMYLGKDGSPIIVVGLTTTDGGGTPVAGGAAAALAARLSVMHELRRTTDVLRGELLPLHPDIAFGWTGETVVYADMRRVSSEETRKAELRVLPITLVLLLIAFRSWLAAILPMLCGGLTIWIALGAVAALNSVWPSSLIVVSIISMVGLGLSIDYALLVVSHYRDALEQGLARAEAVAQAARHAGRTVALSGSAVAIGFAAMLMVPVSEVASVGLGGLLVTTVAVLVASSLLPVLLAWAAPWLDAGARRKAVQSGGGVKVSDPADTGSSALAGRRWRRWARWVARHPLAVLLGAGLPLVLLATQATHLRIDLPRGRWLPDSAESIRVLHGIDAVARGNFGQIIPVVLELPRGTTLHDEAGWRAESRLVRHFARDPRIQHVWAVTTLNPVPLGGPEILGRLPDSVRRSFVSADASAGLIELLPRTTLTAADATALVRDIRAASPEALTGLAGTRFDVGGAPGFNVDYETAIRGALGPLMVGVVGATLLVLALAFRSILIPVKAVVLNLLSVAAAFGAVALVFQDGYGSRLVGLPGAMAGGFPIVPVLVFCIVFGLSMDYEVFIVARIAHYRRAGLSDADALVEGLARTGRVITFAALIMVMIFGGFILGDFIVIKILGFALSTAVLLDATVVRLALGPALIQLAGRWNWWPGR